MRVTVVGAVRDNRESTRTAIDAAVPVGGCVEMVLNNHQGCIKEQIVDAPVLQFQEGVAEQIVDFTVPSIKVVSALGAHPRTHRGAKGRISRPRSRGQSGEVFQALFQERVHEHIVEQTVDFKGECGVSALSERAALGAH